MLTKRLLKIIAEDEAWGDFRGDLSEIEIVWREIAKEASERAEFCNRFMEIGRGLAKSHPLSETPSSPAERSGSRS